MRAARVEFADGSAIIHGATPHRAHCRCQGDSALSFSEFLRLLEILVWPAVAVVAILVIRPHLSNLLSGARIKISIAGQSIETTLSEVRQIFEEQAGEEISPRHVEYLAGLIREGSDLYPGGVRESEQRQFLRPLRNAGLVLTVPRNEFLGRADAIEISALGRAYVRARRDTTAR